LLASAVCALLACSSALAQEPAENEKVPGARVVIVTGAFGAPEYEAGFARAAQQWEAATAQGGGTSARIGPRSAEGPVPDREQLRQLLAAEPGSSEADLWIVLIGHGTYDGKEAKFNLRGPDVSSADLAEWLQPFRRRVIVIAGMSSSGPFLSQLSQPGRVVITATQSGSEKEYARLGEQFASALLDPQADLDQDGQVSLLEGYLAAGRRTQAFYEQAGRLATEHPLLDDTGDKKGTPLDWFEGQRAMKKAAGGGAPDGRIASQIALIPSEFEKRIPRSLRKLRDEAELELIRLRDRKSEMSTEVYDAQLEVLLLTLARLADEIDRNLLPLPPRAGAP